MTDAPGDDRKLVTWRSGEVSQFITGCALDDRWQCVLICSDDLLVHFPELPLDHDPDKPDRAPNGHLFIDHAIAAAMNRLEVTEGPATKRFLDAVRDGIIRTFQRHGGRGMQTVSRARWASAEIDLHAFREAGQSGLKFPGELRHLHNVVIAADDFEYWLRAEANFREPFAHARAECLTPAKGGRRATGLNYQAADLQLVEAGVDGVRAGEYLHATDAARALARNAAGSSTEASKVARLAKQIKSRLEFDSEC